MAGNDDLLDMPPNQLRICLMRARELPVMDVAEGLCSGSSDPFATLVVEPITKDDMKDKPQVLRSTTKVQSLRPVYLAASESTQNRNRDHPSPSLMDTSRVDAAREPENRGNTRNRRHTQAPAERTHLRRALPPGAISAF